MDGRHFKILTFACLCLGPVAVSQVWSQEPGGPVFRPGKAGGPLVMPRGEGGQGGRFAGEEARRRMEQLPPDERETFKRNLETWRGLPPEERTALRNMAHEHMHAEIDKAVQDSGLRLNEDQRELFSLRYTQERRKLERDLQSQAAAERARRMPEIVARLRHEFGGAGAAPAAAKPSVAGPAEARPEVSAVPIASPAATGR
jgi:hypothetical protein